MKWLIEYQYGAYVATNPFGNTIWALSEAELTSALETLDKVSKLF